MKKSFFKYITLFILLISLSAFNFRDVMVGSWNPQYIYNTYGKSIIDFVFADSIIGYMTLRYSSGSILKTTNGGNNWNESYSSSDSGIYSNIIVFNKDSVLVCEANFVLKTTNGGQNWQKIYFPQGVFYSLWIYAFNFDTIWAAGGTGMTEVLYLTTNGGINWNLKFNPWSGDFTKVYFYNKRIGFCCDDSKIYKTTNGGDNWFLVSNETSTKKIQFIDSLTGWRTNGEKIKKTTNGGYNWIIQNVPTAGNIYVLIIFDFSLINKDTLWCCGGSYYFPPLYNRGYGLIWKSTNGGNNWGYQLPDTNTVKFGGYDHIYFLNKNNGWVYRGDSNAYTRMGGVHTVTGGLDSTIYVKIKQQTTNVSSDFILYQNYPNPFNPTTSIRYKVENIKQIKIFVFDILGKKVTTLVNEKKKAGEYEVTFNALSLSSCIYYYALYADGVRMDAKKMVLIK